MSYDDLDLSFERKEKLVQQAKELAESEAPVNALTKVAALRKQWRRSDEYESNYEEELYAKFDSYLSQITARKAELTKSAAETKATIIEEAKKLLESSSIKKATAEMNELMAQWKAAGNTDRETDDQLWEQFKEVRNEFSAKRKEYYNNLTEKFAASKAAKEELIAKVKELAASTDFRKSGNEINALMDSWKAAGSAGRDNDDDLWKQFSAARNEFYANRKAHYAQLEESYKERAAKKEELLAEAKKCVAQSDFSDEMVEKFKGLRAQWKEVGFCGKDKEEELWAQFNETVNNFFNNMKYYR
jgi:hypothetical protein